MLAGLAKVEITPSGSVDLSGYVARTGPSEGVHDPLYCRALVLSEGDQTLALLVCDTLCFGLEYSRQAKRVTERATGIPSSHIMLAATHTHSAPASAYQIGCGDIAATWLLGLPTKMAQAVCQAQANAAPVRLATGTVHLPGLAVNRREAQAPIDDRLRVLCLTDARGRTAGVLAQFACHPVVFGPDNRLVSADYPGVVCRRVEELAGVPCIFLLGPCGDVNPASRGAATACHAMGEQIARAAVRMAVDSDALTPLPGNHLASSALELRLPLAPLPTYGEVMAFLDEHSEDLANARASGDAQAANVHEAMVSWARSMLTAYCSCQVLDEVRVPIQCLEVNGLSLIGVAAELLAQFGLTTEEQAGQLGKHVMLTYANGDVGYVAPRQAYGKGAYGYELEGAARYYGHAAGFMPDAGDLVQAAIRRCLEGRRMGASA